MLILKHRQCHQNVARIDPYNRDGRFSWYELFVTFSVEHMTQSPLETENAESRRRDLMDATLDAIAEMGLQGATVREIAKRAGVTPGLIRHYFQSKETLLHTAYREVMATMTEAASRAAQERGQNAIGRLREWVIACFEAPMADPRNLTLWATFISQVSVDPALAEIHRERYLASRDELEAIIADALVEAGRPSQTADVRELATAVSGLLDGLWLECTMAANLFAEGELTELALTSVERIVGLALRTST
jgi:AcrR family transcriptional regulator